MSAVVGNMTFGRENWRRKKGKKSYREENEKHLILFTFWESVKKKKEKKKTSQELLKLFICPSRLLCVWCGIISESLRVATAHEIEQYH